MQCCQVRFYSDDLSDKWDDFIALSFQGTFLHSRKFLSYHGTRFWDRSVIITEAGRWLGVMPAAQNPADAAHVISHPGSTYGGIVHQGELRGGRMVAALQAVARHYGRQGYSRLTYKAVPTVYHRTPAMDDLYALFRLGAARIRCDLSSTIDLTHRLRPSERRRRSLRKAQKAGVQVIGGTEYLVPLWAVLHENLSRKHDAAPVHTLEEITLLAQRFPDQIKCVCAVQEGQVVAGTVLFLSPLCCHAQYIAASVHGNAVSALDAVFEDSIERATSSGRRWFDFGISTEEGGVVLNDGLYQFKSEFGGGGIVHEFYDLTLSDAG